MVMRYELPHRLLDRLAQAQRVAVLTGAALAAECGVPNARGALRGSWATYDLIDLATPQAFLRNPRLVWGWYAYRRSLAERAEPGSAHYALVDLEQYFPSFQLITQTIDGLHWRAGSRELIELNGSLNRVRCYECSTLCHSWDTESHEPLPCAHCGAWLRPDVVLYGEGVSSKLLRQSQLAAEQAEVFLIIGASELTQPAARLPLLARRAGAYLVEVNQEETAMSLMVDEHLPCAARDMLPLLAQHLMNGGMSREEAV
jgi:NAD-dependent deacetylase